jgi:hypothetical protein
MQRIISLTHSISIHMAGEYHTACRICRAYCDDVGLCVTVEYAYYIYTDGGEEGVCITLRNYPRFPTTQTELFAVAEALALRLMQGLEQQTALLTGTDVTVWLNDRGAR